MTTRTTDRPGITDRPDTIYKPVTGAFAAALIGYGLCFKCEWVHGCENEVVWFADLHGCETAHLCDVHMALAAVRFRESIEEYSSILCRHCKKRFVTWETWLIARPI